MSLKTVHLICNAHLDPVWLWEWEEGAAEAVSTFRTAADLCEEFDGFVFNHNEAILYRWVEEFEPALFARIQRLVRAGKWHIMGGWHLQPDCNMPSGESFVRQILLGRRYFSDKFGVRPTTAINFDPFGHSRGLVQVLARSGYDAYILCRPGQAECPLPSNRFIWEGLDGSRVLVTRPVGWYNSPLGAARKAVEERIVQAQAEGCTAILWGVGDHGGGPSRQDLRDLAALMRERRDVRIRHSTPEAYARELRAGGERLPVVDKALNPWAVGCYTSQVRIKQKHRLLENELYATEKMAAAAAVAGLGAFPREDLQRARYDLATSQFHDILPGSSIQPVEDTSLRLLSHGLETVSRLKARAFFALASGQPKARDGRIPILVYNPHPFPVRARIACEFNLADQIWTDGVFADLAVRGGGKLLPSQVEQEASNVTLEWRKCVVVAATLAPSAMNRFDCEVLLRKRPPALRVRAERGRIRVKTRDLEVVVSTRSGLLDRAASGGVPFLSPGAGALLVMRDNEDPWGMHVRRFRREAGRFRLLSAARAAVFAGVRARSLPPVRVIEDGPVRTVVEALFGYRDSFACRRYLIPKSGADLEIETRVHWNEKDRMLKLALPTPLRDGSYVGQTVFGHDTLPADGDEAVAQKWVAAVSRRARRAVTVINNGLYGSDFRDGEIRLSLVRSPAYSSHPIGERPPVPQDRLSPRIDQGEFLFRVWVQGGPAGARLNAIDREAIALNEKPMALSFFPAGGGRRPRPFMTLDDEAVLVSAVKEADRGTGWVVRLYEPTGRARRTVLTIPALGIRHRMRLGRFEVRTLRIDPKARTCREVNLMEEPL